MNTFFPRAIILLLAAGAAAYAQVPVVTPGSVSNAANGGVPVTPGSLVAIYGSELAGGLAQADSIPLATTLMGLPTSETTSLPTDQMSAVTAE